MELFDEDLMKNEKTDNKKTTTIIMVIMIFLIIMVLLVAGAMIYIKQTALNITINGQTSNNIKNIISIDENNPNKVYVSIKDFSKVIGGYETHRGSYTLKSEEINECYVECQNEVAMFTLNSNIIYKTLTDGNLDFEYFSIDEPVKSINGELYTTIEGIERAFNVSWNYDVDGNKMKIYTMPYLISRYSQKITDYGYDKISEDFTNQKAILDGWLIVEQSKESSNKKIAVLDFSGEQAKTLLEPKYEEIKYLQRTKDFLITADGKKGIISSSKETRVKPQYDDITLMDYDSKLYLVKKANKYGIINFYGQKVIETEYEEIGINNSQFKENDIKNKYILSGSLIPVKYGRNWGFFDITGRQITDFEFSNIGYITSNNKAGSGYSLVTVPDYNVIVVGKDKKYTVITTSGEKIWGFVFDSIYLQIYGGQTSYILEYDSKTYDLLEQLDGMGYGKNKNSNSYNYNQQNQEEDTQDDSFETQDENNQEEENQEEVEEDNQDEYDQEEENNDQNEESSNE